jgi:hypothetical protein
LLHTQTLRVLHESRKVAHSLLCTPLARASSLYLYARSLVQDACVPWSSLSACIILRPDVSTPSALLHARHPNHSIHATHTDPIPPDAIYTCHELVPLKVVVDASGLDLLAARVLPREHLGVRLGLLRLCPRLASGMEPRTEWKAGGTQRTEEADRVAVTAGSSEGAGTRPRSIAVARNGLQPGMPR